MGKGICPQNCRGGICPRNSRGGHVPPLPPPVYAPVCVCSLSFVDSTKGGGPRCRQSGPKECLDGGREILYLELSDLHDFFRQCSLYNILPGFLKKSRLFPSSGPPSTSTTATWWSPTSKFVIQVNLTYYTCFMPNFLQGIH